MQFIDWQKHTRWDVTEIKSGNVQMGWASLLTA